MNTFKTITGTLLSIFSAIFLEYFLRFRPSLAEKFVLKSDCQRTSDKIHRENREDHQIIFNKLSELKEEIAKTQNLILRELAKK